MKGYAVLGFMLAALLLSSHVAAAETFSLVDEKFLPIKNINDPISHKNERIARYSFEQLDHYLWNSPTFLRWNDGERVCEAMEIMFGVVSERCHNLPPKTTYGRVQHHFVAPSVGHTTSEVVVYRPQTTTTRAQTTLTITPRPSYTTNTQYHTPRPKTSTPRSGVVVVDPMYGAYGTTYRPYAWA